MQVREAETARGGPATPVELGQAKRLRRGRPTSVRDKVKAMMDADSKSGDPERTLEKIEASPQKRLAYWYSCHPETAELARDELICGLRLNHGKSGK